MSRRWDKNPGAAMLLGLGWNPDDADYNDDGKVSAVEKFLNDGEKVAFIVVSQIMNAIRRGVKAGVMQFLPQAMNLVAELAMSKMSGEQKRIDFDTEMKTILQDAGIEAGKSAINFLRETAYQEYLAKQEQ